MVGIAHCGHIDVIAVEEPPVRSRVRINADRKNRQVGPVTVQLFQCRCLLDARRALAPPEIQQHHLASVVRQVNGVLAIADREVRRNLVRIGWTPTAIAAARKRQHEKGTNRNETMKPHILIIRSDSH